MFPRTRQQLCTTSGWFRTKVNYMRAKKANVFKETMNKTKANYDDMR